MRIRELYLKAFGPFTERRIAFFDRSADTSTNGSAAPGLVVVYGPNEAGKSSALRAIRDLLYGIPARSSDNFVHAHPQMRVGARLVFADGEELAFLRRKGTKDTLLAYPLPEPLLEPGPESGAEAKADSAGGTRGGLEVERPIEAPRLEALVETVPEALFENFYGLDHAELSRGSKALLEDDGELGRALFAAGLGAGNLRGVLEGLDEEAEGLFKARGSQPRINRSLAELKQIKSGMKEKALRPTAWREEARAAEKIQETLARLEGEIEQSQAERVRLDRIRRTLPALGRRTQAQEALAPLSGARPLGTDFEERLRDARSTRAAAIEKRDRAEAVIARQAERLESLEQTPALLAAREAIELLGERIGGYRDEIDQLPRRESQLESLDAAVREILEGIGEVQDSPASLAALKASTARSSRTRELASEAGELQSRLDAAARQLDSARLAVEEAAIALEGLDDVPDLGALSRALERARRHGELDERLAATRLDAEAREEACERGLVSLGLWSGPLDELDRVAFAEVETVDVFASRFDALERTRERLLQEAESAASERHDADEQLARLRGEGAVPSEAERDARRQTRDATWRRIRRQLIEAGPVAAARAADEAADAPEQALPDRLEVEIASADETADRLRDDAQRVALESQLVARIERLDAESEARRAEERTLEVSWNTAQSEWRAIWSEHGVSPGTPAEMRGWLERLRRLKELLGAARLARREWQAGIADRDEACGAIQAELVLLGAAPGTPSTRLDEMRARGEEIERRFESTRARAERAREASATATARFEEAGRDHRHRVEALATWRREWCDAVQGLGFSGEPRPAEALDRLERLAQLFERARERDQLAERVAKMKSDVVHFEQDVAELVPRCAPELAAAKPDQAIAQLRGMLAAAEKQQAARVEIEAAIEAAREEHETALRTLEQVEEQIASLRSEASVDREEELDGALRAWRALDHAVRALDDVEAQLAEVGDGRPIAALEAAAKEVDADALPGRLERLDEELARATSERSEMLTELGARRDALGRMDGSAEVARLAEAAQDRLAAIETDARRYAVLRLAREVLGREIERYRQRNQAPVLDRASELFRALTRGAYPRVQSEYDDADRAQLRAVREDGQVVGVDGLSSGTRDQLFLALRLATLEETLERSEPMPLVADDILVEFDDDRSRATLEVLAGLAEKTQILLFTHHAHVAEQARELGSAAQVVEL